MSAPQVRQASDLPRHSRPTRFGAPAQRRVERAASARRIERHGLNHRLSWFEATQGVAFFGFVMLLNMHDVVAGLLIGVSLGMCIGAMIATWIRARALRPMHLAFAIGWMWIEVIYALVRL